MSELREKTEQLEQTKDAIVAYFLTSRAVDETTKGMWIADSKETYFLVVAAHELALGATREQKELIEASRGFLAGAQSRMQQCSSELRALGDAKAKELDSQLRARFDDCVEAINAELDAISPRGGPSAPAKTVVRVSETEYVLHCSACGRAAARFRVGLRRPSSRAGEMALLYEGTTKSTQLSLADSKVVFQDLTAERLAAVNSFLEERMEGGLDAYCPTCDKVYCRDDYAVEEEWDEGFYDCSYGTCPVGHRRLIDD